MSDHFVQHATFVVEKTFAVTPKQVFDAWSDPVAKNNWFPVGDVFEFRVGGREYNKGQAPDGKYYTYDSCYQEIVPDKRIVYTYSMDLDDKRISVSITTVELLPMDGATKLIYTEQGAFFDGHDRPELREQGTIEILNGLGHYLEKK